MKTNRRTHRYDLLLSPEERDQLADVAHECRISSAEFIRRAVRLASSRLDEIRTPKARRAPGA